MQQFDLASPHTERLDLLAEMSERFQRCWSAAESYKVAAYALSHLCPGSSGELYVPADTGRLQSVAVWGGDLPADPLLPAEHSPAWQSWQPYVDAGPQDWRDGSPFVDLPLVAQDRCAGLLRLYGASRDGINLPELSPAWVQAGNVVAAAVAQVLATLQQRSEALEREIQRAAHSGQTLGLLLVQVDGFARLVRLLGSAEGERVLREVGHLVRQQAGDTGLAYRLRDHLFLLLLPATPPAAAHTQAEQVRDTIRALDMGLSSVTVSVGVVSYPGATSRLVTAADLIRMGEAAVLRAEIAGGDGVSAC